MNSGWRHILGFWPGNLQNFFNNVKQEVLDLDALELPRVTATGIWLRREMSDVQLGPVLVHHNYGAVLVPFARVNWIFIFPLIQHDSHQLLVRISEEDIMQGFFPDFSSHLPET